MNDREILKKAIDIAIENGYKPPYKEYWRHINKIFSHDFAKAFWGEGKIEWKERENLEELWEDDMSHPCNFSGNRWQYHLQQMVLEENPINYLRKFIDETYI